MTDRAMSDTLLKPMEIAAQPDQEGFADMFDRIHDECVERGDYDE